MPEKGMPKVSLDAERHRRTPRLSAISGNAIRVWAAVFFGAMADSMRDAGRNWRRCLYNTIKFRNRKIKLIIQISCQNLQNIILDRVAAQPPRPLSGAKSQRSGLITPKCRSLFFSGSPARSASGPRAQGKGALRGPRALWGHWGLFRSHSEWMAITSG